MPPSSRVPTTVVHEPLHAGIRFALRLQVRERSRVVRHIGHVLGAPIERGASDHIAHALDHRSLFSLAFMHMIHKLRNTRQQGKHWPKHVFHKGSQCLSRQRRIRRQGQSRRWRCECLQLAAKQRQQLQVSEKRLFLLDEFMNRVLALDLFAW